MHPALLLSLSQLTLPPTLLLPPLPQLLLPLMPALTPLTTDHGAEDTVAGGAVADTVAGAATTTTTRTPTATTHTLATATLPTATATAGRLRRSI